MGQALLPQRLDGLTFVGIIALRQRVMMLRKDTVSV